MFCMIYSISMALQPVPGWGHVHAVSDVYCPQDLGVFLVALVVRQHGVLQDEPSSLPVASAKYRRITFVNAANVV